MSKYDNKYTSLLISRILRSAMVYIVTERLADCHHIDGDFSLITMVYKVILKKIIIEFAF